MAKTRTTTTTTRAILPVHRSSASAILKPITASDCVLAITVAVRGHILLLYSSRGHIHLLGHPWGGRHCCESGGGW